MPDELTSVIATAACLVAAFWLGQAFGGSLAYNKALDDVSVFGFEAVNAHWDRQRPQFIVRDKDLKPQDK